MITIRETLLGKSWEIKAMVQGIISKESSICSSKTHKNHSLGNEWGIVRQISFASKTPVDYKSPRLQTHVLKRSSG